MSTLTMTKPQPVRSASVLISTKRLESIDLLRGIVMIIMALDHVRDYFHKDAFLYAPEDLSQTSGILFFTRWITHFCAPVFVFLAGTSAFLYGSRRTRKELSYYLFTRGLWLIFVEVIILNLFRTFNPAFHYINVQVIWAIGICMIALSALIYLKRSWILSIGIVMIFAHNLLDSIHVPGNGAASFFWAFLHDSRFFQYGYFTFHVHYPVIPWIGIMAVGYCLGSYLYTSGYDPQKRRKALLSLGVGSILLFAILRLGNIYGDAANWSSQKNGVFSFLSFLNVTKYPPSLLYTLLTLGPALIVLAVSERPLNALTSKIITFGRVPMFYYLAHILLIHILAMIGAVIQGYKWSDMILTSSVLSAPTLKGYGFSLLTVYLVWAALVLFLYPFCKRFMRYKKENAGKWWTSYI